MSNRLYTQREVSQIFSDVPNKTLIYWARQGLVEWVAETRDARGIARLYNYWNLFQIGFVRELAGIGFSIENIREIMNSNFKDFPPEKRYVIDDEGKEVEEGLPSEFFSSEDRLKYLIIVKGSIERGWPKTLVIARSNLTDKDYFQLKLGFHGKRTGTAENLGNKTIHITTFVIINLFAIEDYVTFCIEKSILA